MAPLIIAWHTFPIGEDLETELWRSIRRPASTTAVLSLQLLPLAAPFPIPCGDSITPTLVRWRLHTVQQLRFRPLSGIDGRRFASLDAVWAQPKLPGDRRSPPLRGLRSF